MLEAKNIRIELRPDEKLLRRLGMAAVTITEPGILPRDSAHATSIGSSAGTLLMNSATAVAVKGSLVAVGFAAGFSAAALSAAGLAVGFSAVGFAAAGLAGAQPRAGRAAAGAGGGEGADLGEVAVVIEHGRRVCRPKPLCPECEVRDICRYPHKTPSADGECHVPVISGT